MQNKYQELTNEKRQEAFVSLVSRDRNKHLALMDMYFDYYMGDQWSTTSFGSFGSISLTDFMPGDRATFKYTRSGKKAYSQKERKSRGKLKVSNIIKGVVNTYSQYTRGDEGQEIILEGDKVDEVTKLCKNNTVNGTGLDLDKFILSQVKTMSIFGSAAAKVIFNDRQEFSKIVTVDPRQMFFINDNQEEDNGCLVRAYYTPIEGKNSLYAEVWTEKEVFKYIDGALTNAGDTNNPLGFIPYSTVSNLDDFYFDNVLPASDVRDLINPQDDINIVLTDLGETIRMVANPVSTLDTAYLKDTEDSTAEVINKAMTAMEDVETLAGKFVAIPGFKLLNGAEVPTAIFTYIDKLKQNVLEQTGIPAFAFNSQSIGNVSELTMERMVESLKKAVANKRSAIEAHIAEVSSMMLKDRPVFQVTLPPVMSNSQSEKLKNLMDLYKSDLISKPKAMKEIWPIAGIADDSNEIGLAEKEEMLNQEFKDATTA